MKKFMEIISVTGAILCLGKGISVTGAILCLGKRIVYSTELRAAADVFKVSTPVEIIAIIIIMTTTTLTATPVTTTKAQRLR
jgi:hypothetical protein